MKKTSLHVIILVAALAMSFDAAQAQTTQTENQLLSLRPGEFNLFRLRAGQKPTRTAFRLMSEGTYSNAAHSRFSLAATANPVTGSGTAGRIAKWSGVFGTSTFVLGNSSITEDKFGKVGIGTSTPTSPLTVAGLIETINPSGGIKFADGTIQTTSATGALFSISHDATLMGNGTAASPLGIAIPLRLEGSSGLDAVLTVSNTAPGGEGIQGTGGDGVSNIGGTGVVGGGGNSVSGNGGNGMSAVGGNSNMGFGGDGLIALGGLSHSSVGGAGVIARGGRSNGGIGGSGIRAVGGEGSGNVGGEGVTAIGGDSDSSNGGSGVRGFGGDSITENGGEGVLASGGDSNSDFGGTGLLAIAGIGPMGNGPAGRFVGDVSVSGTLSKGAGSFKIDHPLDPENKYLYHSFVESPDMKNIYDGNVITDANGEATVELPAYFEALNRDFRYQLTVIGTFAQAIIAEEIKNNHFRIRTSVPNVKVSWQVTGIRQDAFANRNRIKVEVEKTERERGHYLHPEAFDQPEERSVEWARDPRLMQQIKEMRRQARQKQQ